MTAVGILSAVFLIALPTYGHMYVMKLRIMFSVHPELDNSLSWKRQYRAIFRLLRFKEVAWHHLPFHVMLWVVVMLLSVPEAVMGGAKRMGRLGRNTTCSKSQDVQLERLL